MKTYQDFEQVKDNEKDKQDFCIAAINDHKSSDMYIKADIARKYFKLQNVTISVYSKYYYNRLGEKVPDTISPNHKCVSGFFKRFIIQEVQYLLGNGITFNKPETKEKLGGDMFDEMAVTMAEAALWGGAAFGFFNVDKVDAFTILEFVPLFDELTSALRAGIRFWQVAENKPLMFTLYETDGYTTYKRENGEITIIEDKKGYIENARISDIGGEEVIGYENYENKGLPIVPLWGNSERQSELTGLRGSIDAYDLIKSGFANNLESASEMFWVLRNAGGMDDESMLQFLDNMRRIKVATAENGAEPEPHTMEFPYNAREVALERLRADLYEDAMAVDTRAIASGAATATAIKASYELLQQKCTRFEYCVRDFIDGLLKIAGIEDSPKFKYQLIVNAQEDTQIILSAANLLDQQTALEHLPFLSPDEIPTILERTAVEEMERFETTEETAV